MEGEEDLYGTKTVVFANGQATSSPQRITPEQLDSGEKSDAKPGVPRKPITAYFLFMSEQRKETSLSMKEISVVWNSMSANDKQVYIQKANEIKQTYDRYLAETKQTEADNQLERNDVDRDDLNGLDMDPDVQDPDVAANDLMNSLFPFSRVKNLLKQDKDSSDGIRIEAVKFIQEAAYNFARELVTQSILHARKQKKKKLTAEHILKAADVEAKYSFLLESNIWGEELEKHKKESGNTPRKSKEAEENNGVPNAQRRSKTATFKSPRKDVSADRFTPLTTNLETHFAMMAQRANEEPRQIPSRMVPERHSQVTSQETHNSKPKNTALTSFFAKKV